MGGTLEDAVKGLLVHGPYTAENMARALVAIYGERATLLRGLGETGAAELAAQQRDAFEAALVLIATTDEQDTRYLAQLVADADKRFELDDQTHTRWVDQAYAVQRKIDAGQRVSKDERELRNDWRSVFPNGLALIWRRFTRRERVLLAQTITSILTAQRFTEPRPARRSGTTAGKEGGS